MLAIDPLGIVGDGGRHAFEAEMDARTAEGRWWRLHELEEKNNKTAKLSPDEHDECDAITWPACFADPENVMPRPPMAIREHVSDGLASEVNDGLEEVAAALGKERCHMASWPGPRAHSHGDRPLGPAWNYHLTPSSRSCRTLDTLSGRRHRDRCAPR